MSMLSYQTRAQNVLGVEKLAKLKITVVRAFSPEEVFGREFRNSFGDVVEKCDLEEGQSWISTNYKIPEGFCNWAWEDMRKDRYLLALGGDIPDTSDGVVYVPCSDGKRPVVFKLERL
jgi:uncharacterized repeat protein (TIGR04076 family)